MMTKRHLLILTPLLALAAMAHGQDRAVQAVDTSRFNAVTAAELNPASLLYTDSIQSFDDWAAKAPDEKAVLSLYKGYEEPTVVSEKNGVRKEHLEKLTIYVAKTKTLLGVPAAQINLAGMINLGNISKLDGEVIHKPIQAAEFMSNVAGKRPITNFQWCNKSKQAITRVQKEIELGYLNPKDRAWCGDAGRSICVESCFLFNKAWSAGVALVNAGLGVAGDSGEQKDYGLAMQSEIRYFLSEAEYGQSVPLSHLTHLDSPVRGIVEQNIFYINQVFQFGKIVSILQEDPNDAGKTVMTNFVVMGVRTRSWKKYPMIPDVLGGVSNLNTSTGMTAGIPVFTQNMTKAIAKVLEGRSS